MLGYGRVLLLVVLLTPPAFGGEGESAVRPMEDLSRGMATALAASLEDDLDSFGKALGQLAQGSERLDAHGEGFGKTTTLLRTAMARDIALARAEFDAGRFDAAERRVHQTLDHCFACHTRIPAGAAALGASISQGVNVDSLAPRDRVFFLVATRQFDDALQTTETALRSPGSPGQPTAWLFEAYLKLALRVQRSHERVRKTLESYRERPGLPPYLGTRIAAWIETLRDLQGRGELAADPATARALIDEGRLANAFPADKRGLVHFVTASGLLLRFLEASDVDSAAEAEAYFLLGVAESHISSTLWNDQTDHFLETAIRLKPHTVLAADAYAFLEEYVMARYSSASETFVPAAIREHLDELATLAAPDRPGETS